MALKDILIHMDSTPQCGSRLDMAVNLACRQESRLTGLYVTTHAPYSPQNSRDKTKSAAVESIFRKQTAEAGIEADWLEVDWEVVGVTVSEVVTLHSYYADLVVVGQSGPIVTDLPERLVLGSGRPVLIVPYAGRFAGVGEKVMVAWKPGRESTRAVNDALPILQAAREVMVVMIGGEGEDGANPGPAVSLDICAHLARHGVRVKSEQLKTATLPVADILLNRVMDEGIDLLVTGTYSHNPKGAPVPGPVARQLLRTMTVPVLMAH